MNNFTLKELGEPEKSPRYKKILDILNSKDKIPYLTKIYNYYYNFWQDEKNPKGLWRRISSIDEYLLEFSSNNSKWEIVLDLDDLGKKENESWVFKGYEVYNLYDDEIPLVDKKERCLLKLSKGGSDAVVVREFDLKSLQFVLPDSIDQGFVIPEFKTNVAWY